MTSASKFIDCLIPISVCNLKCPYYFVEQRSTNCNENNRFQHSPEEVGQALSSKRLGGICHFNISAEGETLLDPNIVQILYNLLHQGHYIMVVTNGTITKRFEEISEFPSEYLNRLGFKFSFHYLQLIDNNLMDTFFYNIHLMENSKVSISVELTPHDELVPYIEDIKRKCIDEVGAKCHVTVARNEKLKDMPLLTKYKRNEYMKIWNSFDSELFRFKMRTFGVRRTEYCYAGKWAGFVNIGTGAFSPCHGREVIQNIYNDLSKPIKFVAIGKKCRPLHCINSHAWLTFGLISNMIDEPPHYDKVRDRTREDGSHWLQDDMKTVMHTKLITTNEVSSNLYKLYDRLRYFYLVNNYKIKRKHIPD